MKASSAFEDYMTTEQQARSRITIAQIKQQYALNDQIRLEYQKKEKEQFEMILVQKQNDILKKYGLPQKFIKEFKLKNFALEEYFENHKQQEMDSSQQENKKKISQVVARCSYDKNMFRALLKIHQYLLKFGISDFQVYITRGQAQLLFLSIFRESEQINLWNDSVDLIQNDYSWLVETIQNRIKLHFSFNDE